MKLKKLALAAAAGTVMLAAAPAFAQYYAPAYGYQPYYGYGYHRHHRYYRPRVVVYDPAPYYYYPPSYYYEPRPVIYGHVGHRGRVGFAIGL